MDIYLCTKPLQYFNVLNLPYDHRNTPRKLFWIPNFIGSDTFIENIRNYDKTWKDVVVVKNIRRFYVFLLLHRCQSVYTAYESSTIFGLIRFLRRFEVFVFEEGASAYLKVNKKRNMIQKLLDHFLGVGDYFGGSKYVSRQYLYYSVLLNKRYPECTTPISEYSLSFRDALINRLDYFFLLSESDCTYYKSIKGKKILIYITDWVVRKEVLRYVSEVKSQYDIVFFKPHPKILLQQYPDTIPGIITINSNVMVEMIFQLLLNNHNQLTIWHHSSNAVLYFLNVANVENMDEVFPNLISEDAKSFFDDFQQLTEDFKCITC